MARVEETAVGQEVSPGMVDRVRDTLEDYWLEYLLVLPTLLMLLTLLWIPFLRGIVMTFYEWPLGVGDPVYIGLGNWEYLFSWDPFFTSIKATVIYSLVTFVQLVVAIIAALVVGRIEKVQSVISGLMMVPYTMPPVVTGAIWLYLLNPSAGPIQSYLIDFGILSEAFYWSSSGPGAMGVIMFVLGWTFWPFMFLIILATFESIPDSYYESAKVYGANRVQIFFNVTLPQIKSAILVALSIRMVWNLAKISQPFTLTGGGPGYETSILAILLYRFSYSDGALGRGYAVGLVLLAISLVFVLLFIREFEKSRANA